MPRPENPVVRKPFHFNISEPLLRIGRHKAKNLPELLQAIHDCPDDSIFQHTFRTLQEHHFIRQGFSNDFAHWTLSSCHEPVLSGQLAKIDVREFTDIAGLRGRLAEIVEEFLQKNPAANSSLAHEPFYFCHSDEVVLSTRFATDTPEGFLDALRKVNIHSIHHHFIEARLRLQRMSNDFSTWLEQEAGLKEAADEIERVDIYTNTLEDIRVQIGHIVAQAAHLEN